ncbi:MAG: M48 family metalloprotease, partial [Bacteroidales bacterium]|nr:M48 family metalloprotease [Bacteroidales bacterium]
KMDPIPNAWTFGDTRIYITLTSGLVDMLTDEELDSVIAHECGHILCRHVLYHTVAEWVKSGLASLGILGSLAVPIEYALLYWSRIKLIIVKLRQWWQKSRIHMGHLTIFVETLQSDRHSSF